MVPRALLGAVAGLAPLLCFARCPDRGPSAEEEFRSSEIVVVGPVVGEMYLAPAPDRPAGLLYTIRVEETLRGLPGKTVTTFRELDQPQLKKGRTYVLFIDGDGVTGLVDRCGNSGPLPEKDDVLSTLRRLVDGNR
jgi:hypothetical protein